MGRKRRTDDGTAWHLPAPKGGYRARPFARTTAATALLIEMLAEDGATWSQVAEQVNFDPDARAIAERFVSEGHGKVPVSQHLGTGQA